MKELIEKRNALVEEMEGLLTQAKTETRAFTEDETSRIEAIKAEIRGLDNTIKAEEELRAMDKKIEVKEEKQVEQRALDEANFLKFIKGEERALDVATNGGVIPTTIANRIIEKVKELSPIYSMATVYNVGGDLVFPVYDEATSSIGAAYSDDLAELTEGTGKFTTVKLQNFIVGTLAKVSKSLINRTDFDLVTFVIGKVAQAIADFLEKELIVGTAGKMEGISSTTNTVTTSTIGAVKIDDLIDLQMAVPEVYQAKSVFIMHKNTLKSLRKTKDNDGNYVLAKDIANGFGWTLLGRPVYISESVPEVATGNKAIFYGDMSGLYVKLAQNVEIQVLNEKYATQHATGVVGYVEADSKVVEDQKIASLVIQ
ncbi:phage major capsid protein [Schinkia azotoformans]|uniref:phage major capsid protein n=1 Tax=Schinkia azotoformans TaxID=1454 RepID=UPI002DB5F65D|nr:phage major capsid protein [Schinkia azotoformans]MEC1757384.1 phage major capsid protein [Schinkia azotoformans]